MKRFILLFLALAACSAPAETALTTPFEPVKTQDAYDSQFYRYASFSVPSTWRVIARTGDVLIVSGPGTPESSVAAAKGSIALDTTNGVSYVKNTGVGTTGWVVLSTGASSGFVPTTRTITTTAPLRIAGASSADLSANRNIDWNAGSISNRVALTTDGTNMTMGRVDLSTTQVTGTLPITGITLGGTNQVLWSNGSVNSWTTDPILAGVITANASGAKTSLQGLVGSTATLGALYLGTTTPSSSNYHFQGNASTSILNAPGGDMRFRVSNAEMLYLTSSGLRIGDGTSPTHALEIAAGGGISWAPTVSTPTITQAAPTNADGQNMIVGAQAANGGNRPGGSLILAGGPHTGSGADGSVLFAPGGNTQGTVSAIGARFGDSTAPTFTGLEVAAGQVLIGGTSATFGRFPAAAATAGAATTVSGQDGTGGGDHNGGPLFLTGGFPAGVGLAGRVSLISDTKELVQAVTLGESNQHVACIARAGNLTSTQMPAGTGDYVMYLGEAITAPTVHPNSGGVLYIDPADHKLKFMGQSGTITPLANP